MERSTVLEQEACDLKDEYKQLKTEHSTNQERLTRYEQLNEELKATISRQSQRLGRLEQETRISENLVNENGELRQIVARQSEKLGRCQKQIEQSRQTLERLETFARRVREQKDVNSTKSVDQEKSNRKKDDSVSSSYLSIKHLSTPLKESPMPDHANANSNDNVASNTDDIHDHQQETILDENKEYSTSPSTRSIVAELRMQLAQKDVEIQQLQQQLQHGLSPHVSPQKGTLRTELSNAIDKYKTADRKQLELMLTRMDEEQKM